MSITAYGNSTSLDMIQYKLEGTHQKSIQAGQSQPALVVDAGAIGGNIIDIDSLTGYRSLSYVGGPNWPSTAAFSVMFRVKPRYTGFPSSHSSFFSAQGTLNFIFVETAHLSSGELWVRMTGEEFLGLYSGTPTVPTWSPTAGVSYDHVFTWDGTSDAGSGKFYIDGVLFGTVNPSNASNVTRELMREIVIGSGRISNRGGFDIEEWFFDNTVIDPTNVQLADDSFGSLNGASRTQFVKSVATVDLQAADLKLDVVAQDITGTYDGTDRHTDPGESNVKVGVNYKANSTSNNKTGTLDTLEVFTDLLGAELAGGVLTAEVQNV